MVYKTNIYIYLKTRNSKLFMNKKNKYFFFFNFIQLVSVHDNCIEKIIYYILCFLYTNPKPQNTFNTNITDHSKPYEFIKVMKCVRSN